MNQSEQKVKAKNFMISFCKNLRLSFAFLKFQSFELTTADISSVEYFSRVERNLTKTKIQHYKQILFKNRF